MTTWATAVHAQNRMTIYMNDGSAVQTYSLSDLGHCYFETGKLFFTQRSKTVPQSISLSSVKCIKFTDQVVSGISDTENNVSKQFDIYVAGGAIHVDGWDCNRQATAVIYAIGGQAFYTNRNWSGSAIDIMSLPQGVYIFRVQNKTFKFSK